jgi:hypothetical protein
MVAAAGRVGRHPRLRARGTLRTRRIRRVHSLLAASRLCCRSDGGAWCDLDQSAAVGDQSPDQRCEWCGWESGWRTCWSEAMSSS